MPFDVEPTMRPLPPSTDPEYLPIVQSIKSVNLMTYLLGNVTYTQLYRDPFGVALASIVERAIKIPSMPPGAKLKEGAYTNVDISIILRDGLQGIQAIAGINNVILGSLFHQKARPATAEQYLVDALRGIYNNSLVNNKCELAHFCCPFLHRQENGVALLPKGAVDLFLDNVGHKTMYNLFTEPKSSYSDAQKYVLSEARLSHFILWDKSVRPGAPPALPTAEDEQVPEKGVFKIRSTPLGNYSKCVNGACAPSTNALDWCNDANGSCSAASTP